MPETTKGKEQALAALAKRRADQPERIDNGKLRAGSPMYFYCIACGHLAGELPEDFLQAPPKLCGECLALREMGWL
jgi:hypothetical protein